MSVVDALIVGQMMGEPDRLDALIREHAQLKTEPAALVQVLLDRQLITHGQAIASVPTLLTDPALPSTSS
jgi:hypothetical protein